MTNSAKKKMMRSQVQASFPYLIALYLPSKTLRYANSSYDITYDGNVYSSAVFSVVPPSRTDSTVSDGTLTFSAIDQTMIEWVRTIDKRVKVDFIAVIDSDSIEPIDNIQFTITNAKWNDKQVTFDMILDDKMYIKIPVDVASTRNIPALST